QLNCLTSSVLIGFVAVPGPVKSRSRGLICLTIAYAHHAAPMKAAKTPAPPTALTVDKTTVAPGGSVTVTLTGGQGGSTDWLSFALVSAPNTSCPLWTYVGSG